MFPPNPIPNSISRCSVLILFLLISAFITSDSFIISYIFVPGEVYRLNSYSAQVVKQTMMGKEQITSNETRIDYIFRVLNIGKDQYLIDLQLDSIWIKMNISGEKVEGTSDVNQVKPGILSKSLTEISRKHLKVNLLPTGDVISVSGADTLFHSVIDSYKQVPEQVKTALQGALDQKFGNENIQLEIGNILAIYSNKAVKSGGHWQTSGPLSGGLPGVTHNNWLLTDEINGELNISDDGIIEPPLKNEFRKFDGIMMKYELKGNKQARYKTDRISGWIHYASTKESINGIVRLQGSSAMPAGISWPISIEWKTECAGIKLR